MGRPRNEKGRCRVSKLFSLRRALGDAIIAANIGWTTDNVILLRQGDLWNTIATAISAAKNGMALHIGIAEGVTLGDAGASDMMLTITLTLICPPQVAADAVPEEDAAEKIMLLVDELGVGSGPRHCFWNFKLRSFADIEFPDPDGGSGFLGRQMVFTRKFSLR